MGGGNLLVGRGESPGWGRGESPGWGGGQGSVDQLAHEHKLVPLELCALHRICKLANLPITRQISCQTPGSSTYSPVAGVGASTNCRHLTHVTNK